jgi:Fe2+ transport system protein B
MFYGVTDRLIVRQQKNVFGVVHPYSARGYSTALATALFDPLAWRNLIHTRFPGFIARDVVRVDLRKYGTALKFYDSEIETMVKMHVTPPAAVIFQVGMLLFFCVIVTQLYFIRPPPQHDKSMDKPTINEETGNEQPE